MNAVVHLSLVSGSISPTSSRFPEVTHAKRCATRGGAGTTLGSVHSSTHRERKWLLPCTRTTSNKEAAHDAATPPLAVCCMSTLLPRGHRARTIAPLPECAYIIRPAVAEPPAVPAAAELGPLSAPPPAAALVLGGTEAGSGMRVSSTATLLIRTLDAPDNTHCRGLNPPAAVLFSPAAAAGAVSHSSSRPLLVPTPSTHF
eukprot:1139143-Pelagomonas_calceolata.AAC.1